MKYWLLKSEPETWSWDEAVKQGPDDWTGVRNAQAGNNMKAMAVGDRCFFYHSGDEKRIVGIAEVTQAWHPDPTDKDGKWGCVAIKTVMPLKTPVTLAQVKAEPSLADMLLVKHSRLSVSPVEAAAWKTICKMGGVKG
jgi:predicted RNA-binding protein with PUA-like domain